MSAIDFVKGGPQESTFDQIANLVKRDRPRSRAALKTAPTPPGQVSPIGTSKLAFLPADDPRIVGYVIYRSLTNSSGTGLAVAYVPQPNAVIGQQQIVSDVLQVSGTYYYWAASVTSAAGGGESVRIAIGRQTK